MNRSTLAKIYFLVNCFKGVYLYQYLLVEDGGPFGGSWTKRVIKIHLKQSKSRGVSWGPLKVIQQRPCSVPT